MKFWVLFLIFIVVGVILCAVAGPAAVLVWGILFVIGLTIASEVRSFRTKEGREQMRREREEEEKTVRECGTVRYWDEQHKKDK